MAHTTDADNADMAYTPTTSSASTRAPILGPPPAAAVMDPEGDVILIILTADKRKVRFHVNSGALCVASPVFRAMIGRHSRFKEASALAAKRANGSEAPYEITLEDDNPNALAVVLRIIHMKHYLVPQMLDEDQLYEVAVICDKYDMNLAVMMWAGNVWIPCLAWDESSYLPEVTGHKWLFIAYVFRQYDLFYALSQDIILTATTRNDESSTLVMTANDGTETNEYIPESILGEIATYRQLFIERMMHCIHKTIEKYGNPSSGSLECKNSNKDEACDSFLYGFLIRAFTLKGLYPIASSAVMHQSIQDLKIILDDIKLPSSWYCGEIMLGSRYCDKCHHILDSSAMCPQCRMYQRSLPSSFNHAITCSPLPDFINEIGVIYEGLEGLDLDKFILTNKEDKGPDVSSLGEEKSLWDYVAYE